MDNNTTEISLKEYEDFLERLASEDSETIITNGGKDHAVILYSVLLNNTEKIVRIFCQSGASDVWTDNKFVKALKAFLDKENTKVQILTAEKPALSDHWKNSYGDRVQVAEINSEDKDIIYNHFRNDKCNFAVFDAKRYRYEYDCDAFKAFGSFNAPKTADQMITLFDNALANKTLLQNEEKHSS